MGSRRIIVKESAATSIAAIAWYIESKGLIRTAEKFTDDVYDYIERLADTQRSYAVCREGHRKALGYKCISYKKKYTIAFIESDDQLIICEFISSKLIYW